MRWISVVGYSVAAVALPAVLSAATVTYSTSGIFSTTGTDSLPVGTGDILFNGLSSGTVSAPSNISFGTFDTSGAGTGSIPSGEQFTLMIDETAPGVGTATEVASLTGSIAPTTSSLTLLFSTTSFTIDGTNYTIAEPPSGIPIVPASTNGGMTTVQGMVAPGAAVPEPATYLGIGSGLALMAFGLRRRVQA